MASFEYAAKHTIAVCSPTAGLIEGTLFADPGDAGSFTVVFLDADRQNQEVGRDTVEPGGGLAPVKATHGETGPVANQPFQRNLRVQINTGSPGVEVPVCLRAAT